MSNGPMMMAVLLGGMCMCSSLAVGGYLAYQNSNTVPEVKAEPVVPEVKAPAPEVKAEPATKRDAVLAQGQAIRVDEFSLNDAAGTAEPDGIDKKKVAYTMSMDINVVEMNGGAWPMVFSNDKKNTFPTGTTQRRPAFTIMGSQRPVAEQNRLTVYHASGKNTNNGVMTKFKATEGTYFNLTWTVANGVLSVYIDGKLDGTAKGAFTWSTAKNTWSWNPGGGDLPINIKNVYWFNKALTASEVALIGKKQTSGVSAYTLRYELGSSF